MTGFTALSRCRPWLWGPWEAGTRIGAQQECLNMLGAAGAGNPPGTNARKLGEITAAAVLAGELSLIGALATRYLAKAHAALGR